MTKKYCPATSPEIKGGTYSCEREERHPGVHLAESGDSADIGSYGKWEIVWSATKALEFAARLTGKKA